MIVPDYFGIDCFFLSFLRRNVTTLCRSGEPLAFALKSFVELMDHGLVSWDLLEPKFIKSVGVLAHYSSFNYIVSCLQSFTTCKLFLDEQYSA